MRVLGGGGRGGGLSFSEDWLRVDVCFSTVSLGG